MLALPPALAAFAAFKSFILVKLVPSTTKPGKHEKYPVDYRTGQVTVKGSGGAHDPNIWMTAQSAITLAQCMGPDYCVGFVFNEHTRAAGFWFLDIDECLINGAWSPLAQELCATLAGCAVEVSQSGRGLHLFGRGTLPEGHRCKPPAAWGLNIELYSSGRFVALGSQHQGDANTDLGPQINAVLARWFPAPAVGGGDVPDEGPVAEWYGPADDDELLRRALQSKSAASTFGTHASFADLWDANERVLALAYPSDNGDVYDRSAADAALAQHLAFWTGKDAARIERMMRRSKLVRDKWDREDYLGARTISGAVLKQRDVLQDKRPEPVATPATSAAATTVMPTQRAVTGETILNAEAQVELFKGCVYVTSQGRVLVPGGELMKEREFRGHFGGYSFVMDRANTRTVRNAWEAFTESQMLRAPRATNVAFRPDLPYATIFEEGGRTWVNKFWPIVVPCKQGDASPFTDHLKLMLPDDRDRQLLLGFMAAVVQYPGVKFQWAPLIQGVEGNGKTYISRVLQNAIGSRYVHWPLADKLGKDFNAYLGDRMLMCVEDIYLPNSERHVLERLKPMIAGGLGFEIEGKGIDQVSMPIVCNWVFNTNHKNGLPKSANDRRIAPFFCAQQTKAHLERDGMDGAYFRTLKAWFENGGYEVTTWFLRTYPIPPECNPALGGIAPVTSSTNQAIERSLGSIEQLVQEEIEQGNPGFAGGWISSMALDRLLDRSGRGALPMSARADIAAALGYEKHPGLPAGRVNNMVAPDQGKPRLYVRRDNPAYAMSDAAAIARAYTASQLAGAPAATASRN